MSSKKTLIPIDQKFNAIMASRKDEKQTTS